MSDEWDSYFSRVNDELASLFLDMGIRSEVPVADKSWLLWAWVYMKQPREDGLTSNEESETMWAIEDAISAAVSHAGTVLVGTITTQGRREFYYYGSSDAGWAEAVAGCVARFEGYQHDLGAQQDSEWTQYLNVLYPGARSMDQIKNRKVIDVLKREGDLLTTARPVQHWAYFKAEADRARFEAAVLSRGFSVVGLSEKGEADGERYCIQFQRVDAVDWESINSVTWELVELAGNDQYDGWETQVVSPKE